MNIIEMQNLVKTSTRKKGHFKFTGKITSVLEKVSVAPALNNYYVDIFKIKQRCLRKSEEKILPRQCQWSQPPLIRKRP